MRRILSITEIAEKEKRTKRIGGIVIIALLVLSSLGFALSGFGGSGNEDNGASKEGFSYNGQNWVYTIGTQKYYFTYHPDDINSSLLGLTKSLPDFAGKQINIDSELAGGLPEISNTLGAYTSKITEVCYGKCERDLPEKECLSGAEPMIIIRENETESFIEKDNCLFIQGNLKTVDAFLYRVLGIN